MIEQLGVYKDITEDDFNWDIFLKKEFYSADDGTSESGLKKHQTIIQRFLSPHTPYSELLLFHAMGTGKTRSSLATALQLLHGADAKSPSIFVGRLYRKGGKIMKVTSMWPLQAMVTATGETRSITVDDVPSPGQITKVVILTKNKDMRKIFYRELAKMARGGDRLAARYLDSNGKLDMRRVRKQFKFFTFSSFAKKNRNPSLFEGTVFIVDEAHNLVLSQEMDEGRKLETYNALKEMFASIRNRKVLLLSGTPMANTPNDIIILMNMILPEQMQIEEIDETQLGKLKTSSDIQSFFSDFNAKTRGRISYLKAATDDVADIENMGEIDASRGFSIFHLTFLSMSKFQTDAFKANSDDTQPFGSALRQVSLMAFPPKADAVGGAAALFGTEGYDYWKGRRRELKEKLGLAFQNLKKFSCKYNALFEELGIIASSRTSGRLSFPVYVYCNLISGGGINTLTLLLQMAGYTEYGSSGTSGSKSYIVLTGSNKPDITVFNSRENASGDICPIIIGSQASSEGYTFNNIKKEIVLTPFWNNVEISQALARGVRIGSHADSPGTVVQIIKYVAEPMGDALGYDRRMYLKAEEKFINNGHLEEIVMNNAVDCALNYDWNSKGPDGPDGPDGSGDKNVCKMGKSAIVDAQLEQNKYKVDNQRLDAKTWDLYYAPDITDEIAALFTDGKYQISLDVLMRDLSDYSETVVFNNIRQMIDRRQVVATRNDRDCFLSCVANTVMLTPEFIQSDLSFLETFYVQHPAIPLARPANRVELLATRANETDNSLLMQLFQSFQSAGASDSVKSQWFSFGSACPKIAYLSLETQEELLEKSIDYLQLPAEHQTADRIDIANSVVNYYDMALSNGNSRSSLLFLFAGNPDENSRLSVICTPESQLAGRGKLRIKTPSGWTDGNPEETAAFEQELEAKQKRLESQGIYMTKNYRGKFKGGKSQGCFFCIVKPTSADDAARDARKIAVGTNCDTVDKAALVCMIASEYKNTTFAQKQWISNYIESVMIIKDDELDDKLVTAFTSSKYGKNCTSVDATSDNDSSKVGKTQLSMLMNAVNKNELCKLLFSHLRNVDRVMLNSGCGFNESAKPGSKIQAAKSRKSKKKSKLTVKVLRTKLQDMGLSSTGKKAELMKRYQDALQDY